VRNGHPLPRWVMEKGFVQKYFGCLGLGGGGWGCVLGGVRMVGAVTGTNKQKQNTQNPCFQAKDLLRNPHGLWGDLLKV